MLDNIFGRESKMNDVIIRWLYFIIAVAISSIFLGFSLRAESAFSFVMFSFFPGVWFGLAANQGRKGANIGRGILLMVVYSALLAITFLFLSWVLSQYLPAFLKMLILTAGGIAISLTIRAFYESAIAVSCRASWLFGLWGLFGFVGSYILVLILNEFFGLSLKRWSPIIILSVWQLIMGFMLSLNTFEDVRNDEYIQELIEDIGEDDE
jgi:hypothetical protein